VDDLANQFLVFSVKHLRVPTKVREHHLAPGAQNTVHFL
jgi:hypothetical protein